MSKRVEHTPGPWRLSDESPRIIKKDFRDIGSDSGFLIASTMGRDDSGFYASNKEADANARLIAAAPCLLEALEAAMAFIDNHVADPDLTDEMCEAYARLLALEPRKLIAKTKGADHTQR